jgi:hypothetical protein
MASIRFCRSAENAELVNKSRAIKMLFNQPPTTGNWKLETRN